MLRFIAGVEELIHEWKLNSADAVPARPKVCNFRLHNL